MTLRAVMYLLISLLGGVVGAFAASLIIFWVYPELQSDLRMFLRDLFSPGAAASAAFIWLISLPAIIVLLFLHKRFMAARLQDWPFVIVLAASFSLVFISQIHFFGAIANGVIEYLLNCGLAGLILTTIMVFRHRFRHA